MIVAYLQYARAQQRLRGMATALWRGEIDELAFYSGFLAALERGFENAWQEGAGSCGIGPGDRTDEEASRLNQIVLEQAGYIDPLAAWIVAHNRESGGKLRAVLNRVAAWENRFPEVVGIAQSMACADQKFRWKVDPSKESCVDCLTMNGRVYRASIWAKYEIRPQSRRLACRGYRCGCGWEPTSDPVTPGRPPGLIGG